MAEVIGIDHVYITVTDLGVSEAFYDRVMIEALGFRKNKFALAFVLNHSDLLRSHGFGPF